jgi:hypothetical protein
MSSRLVLVGLFAVTGCSGSRSDAIPDDAIIDAGSDSGTGSGDGSGANLDGPSATLRLPPHNAGVDYQLGGAYQLPAGVSIVSRDRDAAPAAGAYSICYVNGFQIQPHEEAGWLADHPDLILRTANGTPVIDPDWDEMLIDITTPAKRTAVAAIVGGWIDGCALAGFDALEIDNLDTYARSGGRITEENAVAMMRLFSDAAHARGLAVAQKNSAELVTRKTDLGTDFVVVEECNRYHECGDFTAAYGDHVIVIEYRRADFDAGCTAWPGLSIVLRDVQLVTPTSSGYVFDGC